METSGPAGRAGRTAGVRPIHWLAVVLVLVTAGIHASIGVRTGRPEFVIAGLVFVAGLLLFFTRLFRPVLYLVGAAYIALLTVMWVLAGTPFFAVGMLDAAVHVALFGLFVYLFFVEVDAEPG